MRTRAQTAGPLLPHLGWVLAASLVAAGGCGALRLKNPVAPAVLEGRQCALRGATAAERGAWSEAESQFRRAVESNPQDPQAHAQLAEALWTRGLPAEAIRELGEATRLEPDHAGRLTRLAEMELGVNEPAAAVTHANRSLALDPSSSLAWRVRAQAELRQGHGDRALADLFQALRFAPEDRWLLSELAAHYGREGRHEQRLVTLHRLLATYPPGEAPADVVVSEAEAYQRLGRPHLAAQRLRELVARGGASAPHLYQLAEAEAACGRSGPAIEAAQRALTADSGHAPSQRLLARLTGGPAYR